MSNLGLQHWEAVKWILRYLNGSSITRIVYGGNDNDEKDSLICYVDSDYAANIDNRKSRT